MFIDISTKVVLTIALVKMQIETPTIPEIRHLITSEALSSFKYLASWLLSTFTLSIIIKLETDFSSF